MRAGESDVSDGVDRRVWRCVGPGDVTVCSTSEVTTGVSGNRRRAGLSGDDDDTAGGTGDVRVGGESGDATAGDCPTARRPGEATVLIVRRPGGRRAQAVSDVLRVPVSGDVDDDVSVGVCCRPGRPQAGQEAQGCPGVDDR